MQETWARVKFELSTENKRTAVSQIYLSVEIFLEATKQANDQPCDF